MIRVTSFSKLKSAEWRDRYIAQISRLIPFSWKEIPLHRCPDKRSPELLREEVEFLDTYSKGEFFLLEADGKQMTSENFYRWCFQVPERHLVVGPAIGFHSDFRTYAKGCISLSSLTFTHALSQTILAESLYRSACILKNHPFVK